MSWNQEITSKDLHSGEHVDGLSTADQKGPSQEGALLQFRKEEEVASWRKKYHVDKGN